MDVKHTSLNFKAKVKPLEKINDEFTLVKILVQSHGKNRNMSYMSKENIERCLPTLSYVPVVGHLIDKYDKDGNKIGRYMGGHDYEITDDWEFKSVCVPYGVVKENSFAWEEVEEYEDKRKAEYLTCEAVLWTGRYPELMEAIYSEDFYFNQSMEVSVSEYAPYEKDSNYIELIDFTYSALCLLGKADDKNSEEHTEPCFVESKVIPIKYSLEKDEFAKVMSELKSELAFYFNKYSDGKEEESVEDETKVTETVEEVIEESTEEVVDETTEETPETEEVEEEVAEETETEIEEVEEQSEESSEYDLLKAEYDEYKSTHSHTDEEFDALQKYHDDVEFEKLHSQKEALLSDEKYSILADVEAFATLKKEMDNYSLTDLEKEAKVIYADHVSAMQTFSAKDKPVSAVKVLTNVNGNKSKKSRYGSLFSK